MSRIVFSASSLLLAACTAATSPEPMPPPPWEFKLDATNIVAGQPAWLEITRATPRSTVTVFASRGGLRPGPCPPALGGLCVDIGGAPTVVGTVTANNTGVAYLRVNAPLALVGQYAVFQAFAQGELSNPIGRLVAAPGTALTPGVDADGDGYTYGGRDQDCADFDAAFHPGAPEIFGDGIDHDCDNYDGSDSDGDGHTSIATGGDDCDDTNDDIAPGEPDLEDGIDNDCDGVIDNPSCLRNTGPTEWTVPGTYALTVPDDCTQLRVDVWGAGGGGGHTYTVPAGRGGGGSWIGGFVNVTAGEVLEVVVGGGGGEGRGCLEPCGGGGGGGLSMLQRGVTPLLLAAGGGGGGAGLWQSYAGDGGGGDQDGGDAGNAAAQLGGFGGDRGTDTAGGAGGAGGFADGLQGAYLLGGDGGTVHGYGSGAGGLPGGGRGGDHAGGGGGGGGYFGGGGGGRGGAGGDGAGGGGGGSSWSEAGADREPGAATTPGNAAELPAGHAAGGEVNQPGQPGLVRITW
jgi:hypothetical protein